MKIKNVVEYLESIAPKSLQESYDNAGLIVGDKEVEVTGILIALDTIEAVLDEAMEKGCNLVVAHHPIVFGGLKSFTGKNYVERVVLKAIKNDIAIYAAHTNLDNVYRNGVNGKIAEKIGLTQTKILSPKKGLLKKLSVFVPIEATEAVKNALFEAGAGSIGNYSECSFRTEGVGSFKGDEASNPTVGEVGAQHEEKENKLEVVFPAYLQGQIVRNLFRVHPYEEVAYDIYTLDNVHQEIGSGLVGELKEPMETMAFLKMLKKNMKADGIRYTALCKKEIKRVALCGGAGSFLLKNALAAQADIFITGDYKYHQFFDAENRIIIADIGHYESEQFTIELFYELLTQKFRNFAIRCTEINTNPINYL
ncbi:Nif3-like dinuclear metal center hexameric protein [Aureispira sp. CCB-E]|uniref:Nif3-like dinuclear metal center hexameric protein n=1 Tax=Aureispira sp. CCB-E TaxID=3051121 RepID=UPI0028686339|nr:Nif3-like dinuclear metal center hexameric protein [Aureispira sp. CCB-E]WMX14538.1 Nif3-like dinuclear metal center hexameric protein [Aureispira sp. CCB-E]